MLMRLYQYRKTQTPSKWQAVFRLNDASQDRQNPLEKS